MSFRDNDQDLHVVLEDGPEHMVAESPNEPFWTVNATAYRKKQMAAARDKVRLCTHARIFGVAFWDRPHNAAAGRQTRRTPPHSRLRLLLSGAPPSTFGWPGRVETNEPGGHF